MHFSEKLISTSAIKGKSQTFEKMFLLLSVLGFFSITGIYLLF